MSIPLPPLDDRTYAGLRDEALALIPGLAPQWTNHNPSDPGITLIELFAWLTEMLIYQADRLPDENIKAFLRLLNGPEWAEERERDPQRDLQEDIRTTVLDLRSRHRAVTAEDYEALAREASPGVARVRCVPQRDLTGTTEARRLVPREGYVSLIVVPDPRQTGVPEPASSLNPLLPGDRLLTAVRGHLEPRRLVTVRQAVASPIYVPIQAEVIAAARPDVPIEPLRNRVEDALKRYLDPLTGGPDGEGWPFGRDVYVSELYRLLEKEVPGVDYVPDITLSSTLDPDSPSRCVEGRELWHEEGDQIGIELMAHHLPWARIDPARIVIGSVFLQVHVHVRAAPKPGFELDQACRAAKTAARRLFHPLHGGPGGPTSWTINAEEIETAVAGLREIRAVAAVEITADRSRQLDDNGVPAVRFEAGEIADVTVTVEIPAGGAST